MRVLLLFFLSLTCTVHAHVQITINNHECSQAPCLGIDSTRNPTEIPLPPRPPPTCRDQDGWLHPYNQRFRSGCAICWCDERSQRIECDNHDCGTINLRLEISLPGDSSGPPDPRGIISPLANYFQVPVANVVFVSQPNFVPFQTVRSKQRTLQISGRWEWIVIIRDIAVRQGVEAAQRLLEGLPIPLPGLPAGFAVNSIHVANDSPILCRAGNFVDNFGVCTPCLPGFFAQEDDLFCSPCPLGTYAPRGGSDSCLPCPFARPGSTSCTTQPPSGCTYNGRQYAAGSSFVSIDGCNTCTCDRSGSGQVACTERACTLEAECTFRRFGAVHLRQEPGGDLQIFSDDGGLRQVAIGIERRILRDGTHGFIFSDRGDISNECSAVGTPFRPGGLSPQLGQVTMRDDRIEIETSDNVIGLAGSNSVVGRSILLTDGIGGAPVDCCVIVPRVPTIEATCEFSVLGRLQLTQDRNERRAEIDGVLVQSDPGVNGLRLGDGNHALLVHQSGDIGNNCGDAGGQFTVERGTTRVPSDATVTYIGGQIDVSINDDALQLQGPDSVIGRSIILHLGDPSGPPVDCCTIVPARPCVYDGIARASGETFRDRDGCNTCSCHNGDVACTRRACTEICPQETCRPDDFVACLVDPCDPRFASCPNHPAATCCSSFCGGCHATWIENGREVTCGPVETFRCPQVRCAEPFCPEGSTQCGDVSCPARPDAMCCKLCGCGVEWFDPFGNQINGQCEGEEKCCNPQTEPGQFGNPICTDGYKCCPDTGDWECGIGDGSFRCRGEGRACSLSQDRCCPALDEPGQFGNPICFEGHACCPITGRWECSIGDGRTFPCGDAVSRGQACPPPTVPVNGPSGISTTTGNSMATTATLDGDGDGDSTTGDEDNEDPIKPKLKTVADYCRRDLPTQGSRTLRVKVGVQVDSCLANTTDHQQLQFAAVANWSLHQEVSVCQGYIKCDVNLGVFEFMAALKTQFEDDDEQEDFLKSIGAVFEGQTLCVFGGKQVGKVPAC